MRQFRAPRTTQERRATGKRDSLHIDEYKVRIRARRNFTTLSSSWDDVFRGDWKNRSWKRHRKTQYKSISTEKRSSG